MAYRNTILNPSCTYAGGRGRKTTQFKDLLWVCLKLYYKKKKPLPYFGNIWCKGFLYVRITQVEAVTTP